MLSRLTFALRWPRALARLAVVFLALVLASTACTSRGNRGDHSATRSAKVTELRSVAELRERFNEDSGKIRLILVFPEPEAPMMHTTSPTRLPSGSFAPFATRSWISCSCSAEGTWTGSFDATRSTTTPGAPPRSGSSNASRNLRAADLSRGARRSPDRCPRWPDPRIRSSGRVMDQRKRTLQSGPAALRRGLWQPAIPAQNSIREGRECMGRPLQSPRQRVLRQSSGHPWRPFSPHTSPITNQRPLRSCGANVGNCLDVIP